MEIIISHMIRRGLNSNSNKSKSITENLENVFTFSFQRHLIDETHEEHKSIIWINSFSFSLKSWRIGRFQTQVLTLGLSILGRNFLQNSVNSIYTYLYLLSFEQVGTMKIFESAIFYRLWTADQWPGMGRNLNIQL